MPDALPSQQFRREERERSESKGAKNIVVCCDGTGNEFGDANSNVVKLYTALAIDDQQVGYYHPGVGTMGDPAERHQIPRWWSQTKGLAFAAGFKDNVLDAYRYLMSTFNDGDRVYLFGFSRGAYTVRALAGLLDGYGLLCPGNEGHLPYVWRMYADQHKNRKRHHIDTSKDSGEAFKETFSRKNFEIHFVGVWDTVSSVGWVSAPLRLFNVAQNKTIQRGRHAISIDERRCFYTDNLWGDPLPGQDLLQVWFAGVHSDVGGSYPQKTSGLSNITLEWMLDQAKAAGLSLVEDRVNMILGKGGYSYPAATALYPAPESSYVHKSLSGLWWILELLPHRYYDKEDGNELQRIPLGVRRTLPSGALIHPSVVKRMADKSAGYRPKNLTLDAIEPKVSSDRPGDGVEPPLYVYRKPDGKTGSFNRWSLLVLFTVLDSVVALSLVLLVARTGVALIPYAWEFCEASSRGILAAYAWFRLWP